MPDVKASVKKDFSYLYRKASCIFKKLNTDFCYVIALPVRNSHKGNSYRMNDRESNKLPSLFCPIFGLYLPYIQIAIFPIVKVLLAINGKLYILYSNLFKRLPYLDFISVL